MKKISATMVILLIGITLVNIPADILTTVSADPGEDYPYQPTDDIIIQALGYLRNQQISDGSISGFSISAWAAMAISAAEEDPNDWSNLVEYLRENVNRIDENKATDWERQTLTIVACNEDPRGFDGIDYLAKIESFYDGDQIGSSVNLYDDFFGILALVSGDVDKDSSIIQTVRIFIKENQNENGGWGDVDSTAAAIMALIAAGEDSNSECITDALSYVKTTQAESGGFKSWGTENTASTAWAVMAIAAAGQNPTSIEWKHSGNSSIDFLLSLQQENGAFNWSVHQNMSPEWMTSYVILALLGKPYPVKIYESEGETDEFDEDNGEDASDDTNSDTISSHGDEWTGAIRIEGKNDTICNAKVTFNSSTIVALNDSSGEIETYEIDYPSVLGALDKAAQQNDFSYSVVYYPSWNAFFVKAISGEFDWWHYWVDYNLPMVGTGSYQLTDQDEEILFGFLEDWTARALQIYLDKSTVKKNEEFTVSVYNETMAPVKDAMVYVDSSAYLTDENGNVTIELDTKGIYEIYAEKDGYIRSERKGIQVKKKVEIMNPMKNSVYILGRKTNIDLQKILVFGAIDINVETSNDIEKIEYYVDDTLKHVDTDQPFSWRLNEKAFFKKMTVKVKAYIDTDEYILKIQKIIQYIDSLPENYHGTAAFDVIKSHFKNLERDLLEQSNDDSIDVVVFNLYPNLHCLLGWVI